MRLYLLGLAILIFFSLSASPTVASRLPPTPVPPRQIVQPLEPKVCYNWEDPNLGEYLDCAIPRAYATVRAIFVALAIILVLFLVYKTFIAFGSPNSKELQELPTRWAYVIILALLAIGAGGTILNILINFFGFGTVQTWVEVFNGWLCRWGLAC